MMSIKRIPSEALASRLADVKDQIEKTEARLRSPPMYSSYDPRNDRALIAELHKYVAELNTEIQRRTVRLDSTKN
jgi:uncharacterized small protein (DUF1192 family)